MSSAVPKFASFKPPKKAILPADDGLKSSCNDNVQKHRDTKVQSLASKNPKPTSRPTTKTAPTVRSDADQRYAEDRKGDIANLRYEATDRYRVPQHYCIGCGQVLGLDRRYRVDRNSSSLLGLVLTVDGVHGPTANSRPISSSVLRRQNEATLRFVKPVQVDAPSAPASDFIALGSSTRKRKRGSDASGEQTRDYRSIQGKAVPSKQPSDSDVELASESDGNDFALLAESQARQRDRDLKQLTKENPSSLDVWLDLIAHQRAMIRPGDPDVILSKTEMVTLVDLRMSLYEKAMPLLSKEDRERLLLCRLEEGAKVWSADKMEQKWREALQERPDSHILLLKHLDHVQSQSTRCTYGSTSKLFLDRLNMLQHAARTAAHQHLVPAISLLQVHVMLRMTKYVQQCGYSELAAAIWQTTFDLNMTHQHEWSNDREREACLARIQEAWDMEEPRFGENENQKQQHQSSSDLKSASQQILDPKRPFASFAHAEMLAAERLGMPGRSTEDEDIEDPFHVVFFSNIKPTMDSMSLTYSFDALLDAFLTFHGLISIQGSHLYTWRTDSYLSEPICHPAELEEHSSASQRLTCPSEQQTTIDTLFQHGVFIAEERPSLASLHYINNALKQFARHDPTNIHLAEYMVAFQSSYFGTQAPRTVKNMIKASPSCMALYNAAAMVEAAHQRSEQAIKIWQTSLSMRLKSQDHEPNILLHRCWSWFELHRANDRLALAILFQYGNKSMDMTEVTGDDRGLQIQPAARLRVHRTFEEGFDRALCNGDVDLAWTYSETCALMTYLADAYDLSAAGAIIDSHCVAIRKRKELDRQQALRLDELLEQSRADLIQHHISRHRSYKPRRVLADLERALQKYTSNTRMLELYAQLSKVLLFDPRENIRATLNWSPLTPDDNSTAVQWAFALSQATARFTTSANSGAGTNPGSVRGRFRRCLLGSGGMLEGPMAHAPRMWGMWFAFELSVLKRAIANMEGSTNPIVRREAATSAGYLRQIYLDGIRCLPWCKDWVVMGLGELDRSDEYGMEAEELSRCYKVLVERELRIRVEET